MKFKKAFLTLSIVTLLVGCGSAPNSRAPALPMQLETLGDTSYTRNGVDKPIAPDAGMIRIERHTAGYTISMVLDATDDNVYFVMDLPEDTQSDTKPGKPEEEKTSSGSEPKEDEIASPESDPDIARSADPTQSSKHLVYAQTYFFEKKYSRALDEVNRAIEYSPRSAVAYSLKGSIHYKRGERKPARAAWEKALELDPNLENVNNMLQKVK